MRKPAVDYREFRFSRLNEPRFSHLWLLLGWVGYFLLYFLTENLIPFERCHPVHLALDDLIPFCEYFVIPYCFWYVLVFGSLLWYLLYDIPRFRQLQIFIIITQVVAMAVYIVWPSIQLLRPAEFPRQNFFTWVMGIIYGFDTPTGVCPSLHVAYSIGIASVGCHDPKSGPGKKIFLIACAVVISIATTFVKQHSALDVLTALPLGLLAEALVFRKEWAARFRKSAETTEHTPHAPSAR